MITVRKVPLQTQPVDYPQSFPSLGHLYLELLENKRKIRQELINKPYQPPNRSPDTDLHEVYNHDDESDAGSDHSRAASASRESVAASVAASVASAGSAISATSALPGKVASGAASLISEDDESIVESYEHAKRDVHESPSPAHTPDGDLTGHLQELLTDKTPPGKYTSTKVNEKYDEYQRSRKRAPTLAELEEKGQYRPKVELGDASRLQVNDEDTKRELLFKFDLLKKSYKNSAVPIPTFSVHSDLSMMQKMYDDTVRRLSLDSSVENYKTYLIGAFMGIEFALGKWFNFDMQGYTQQQIISMSSYEKLLIEIGEKSYVPSGKQWPVELRLVFLVLINTAFFIVGKMILKNTGTNLMNMINKMNVVPAAAAPNATTKPAGARRGMKGPSINLDELPDVDE
jgi:hypothetical protein